jgi:hypothetical protein
MGWGMDAVRTREGEGSFYRLGTAEGRRSDEVNASGGGGVLMALQTSVSGWERRGGAPCRRGSGGGIVVSRFPCARGGQRGAGVAA